MIQNGQSYQRIFVVIIDSLGVGATADASHFESLGAGTLGHLEEHLRVRLQLPIFQEMGLGSLRPITRMSSLEKLHAAYGQMSSIPTGLSGRESQWEMMGLATIAEPDVFIDGVPLGIATNFTRKAERPLLSNSLMNIRTTLKGYGLEQLAIGGLLIAMASSSSVWLITHEQIISVGELKEDRQILRKVLDSSLYTIENANGLLFSGNQAANFYPQELYRSPLAPASPTVIGCLLEEGYAVKLIGKSTQFFGLDHYEITGNNQESFVQLRELIGKKFIGICIAEVGEIERFDKARNPEGFGTELMRIDHELIKVVDKVQDDDLLIMTGNFRNDPAHPSEEHTREYVPLLITVPQTKQDISLGGRSFSGIRAATLDNYDLEDKLPVDDSFLRKLFSAYR